MNIMGRLGRAVRAGRTLAAFGSCGALLLASVLTASGAQAAATGTSHVRAGKVTTLRLVPDHKPCPKRFYRCGPILAGSGYLGVWKVRPDEAFRVVEEPWRFGIVQYVDGESQWVLLDDPTRGVGLQRGKHGQAPQFHLIKWEHNRKTYFRPVGAAAQGFYVYDLPFSAPNLVVSPTRVGRVVLAKRKGTVRNQGIGLPCRISAQRSC